MDKTELEKELERFLDWLGREKFVIISIGARRLPLSKEEVLIPYFDQLPPTHFENP